ncbi:MAG: FliO/MopB family protein [Cyanobacteria bacterium HKST-UBA04]|nr:FliO/MopB family protein [Cyanobacteria bacterium HKST-UBA04]
MSYSHYMFNFLFATMAMIAVLYAVYWFVKKNPQLSGMARLEKHNNPDRQLFVEATLNLEPRKRLYVVGYGRQRYLLSSSGDDKTEMLATLDTEAPTKSELTEALQAELALAAGSNKTGDGTTFQSQYNECTTFWQRFVLSIKLLIQDRFSQPR